MSSTAIVPRTELMGDVKALGEAMVASGFFADARSAAQAVVKILAGRELGLGPAQSMASLHIVSGKLQPSADLLARLVRSSGRYTYDVEHLDDDVCVLAFYELAPGHAGRRLLGRSQFSDEDRSRAGLGGDTWKKYPRNMLFSRAMTNGVTWFCPDVVAPQMTEIASPDDAGCPLVTPADDFVQDLDTAAIEVQATSPAAGGSAHPLTPSAGEEGLEEAGDSGPLEEEPPEPHMGKVGPGSSSEPSLAQNSEASGRGSLSPEASEHTPEQLLGALWERLEHRCKELNRNPMGWINSACGARYRTSDRSLVTAADLERAIETLPLVGGR